MAWETMLWGRSIIIGDRYMIEKPLFNRFSAELSCSLLVECHGSKGIVSKRGQ